MEKTGCITLRKSTAHYTQRFVSRFRAVTCCTISAGVLFLSVTVTGCYKKTGKVYTIGIVNTISELEEGIVGFKKGMTELNYIEGENVRYIYNGPTRDPDKLLALVGSLKNSGVDMIFVITTPATLAVKKVTAGTGIPVVFSSVTDPVGAGIVESIQKPGSNITGVSFGFQEAKRLKWLVRIAPGARRMYVPYNVNDKSPLLALKTARRTAAELGVKLILYEITDQETLEHAVLHIPAEADAVFFLPDSLLTSRLSELVVIANKRKLPTSTVNISTMKNDDILTSYGYDQQMSGKQAARIADQIFKGTRPADLPVETADFYLGINLKVAKDIGLTVPDEILRQADVIKRE